jgi:hypothetical protein
MPQHPPASLQMVREPLLWEAEDVVLSGLRGRIPAPQQRCPRKVAALPARQRGMRPLRLRHDALVRKAQKGT